MSLNADRLNAEQLNADRLNADLWGLVLAFALRLDLLDRDCLRVVRSCARVCKTSSVAVWRLEKGSLRLRARVHRLLGFQDPSKSQVRTLFPSFTEDPVYTSAPRGQRLVLAQVSARLVQYAEAPAWVSWAEQRPARISAAPKWRPRASSSAASCSSRRWTNAAYDLI